MSRDFYKSRTILGDIQQLPSKVLLPEPPYPFVIEYSGAEVEFIAPRTGIYELKAWGAEGGGSRLSGNSSSGKGGRGGYSTGQVNLIEGEKIYIHVGGRGGWSNSGLAAGGYNGGGSAWSSGPSEPGNGGGGATHIAKVPGLLNTLSGQIDKILIVAAGGGGGGEDASDQYGDGGGLTGTNNYYAGTQTGAGSGGGFGYGGSTNKADGGGGGGGFYGGGTSASTSTGSDSQGGGGGSSYIANLQNASTTAAQRYDHGRVEISRIIS